MSAWTRTDPPTWFPTAVVGAMGWEHPTTGELLVAISNFTAKNTDVLSLVTVVGATANNEALTTGESLIVVVQFSEAVAVLGTPSIALTVGAGSRTLAFDAAASTATHVAFSYEVTEEDVAAAGTITIGTSVDLTSGGIYDVLPGGGVSPVAGPISFVAPASNLVAFN